MAVDPDSAPPEPLRFADDPGASRSFWVAVLMVLAITGWFASSIVLPSGDSESVTIERAPQPVTVAIRASRATEVPEVFVAEGQAEPDRDTKVLAETSGEIAEVLLNRGDPVTADMVIARFDPRQRSAEFLRAKAELARVTRELRNAETLLDRGSATLDRVATLRAAFAAAEAGVAAAEQAVADTVLRAPFDGRLEDLWIDPGEFVPAGKAVARVVDRDPLTVRARIPQQSLHRIRTGQEAMIAFITGQIRKGVVSFVGANADPETRTFALEVEVENKEGEIPAGVSAEIRIPTGEAVAHFVSPAILALNETGVLGLKTVDKENRVAFYEVAILRAETNGIWVSGLPDTAQIITVGQGFVRTGEVVDPRPDEHPAPAAPGTLE
ncbi:MAG: efflux RND transporter periplasmic adaptor subunit [Rhodobacter sp.]|nr:efflux RND transporter periplasmic adaptor subunit [Rhodobacter sp.]